MNNREAFEAWSADVKNNFSYDPETGFISVKIGYHMNPKGKILSTSAGQGYLKGHFKKRGFLLHRMAWFLHYGVWPNEMIDHKNGNRSDNSIANLRLASHAQNCQNSKIPTHNKSGVKGVYFREQSKKYCAYISINNKPVWIGTFKTIEEASIARREYAEKHQGEFANHG